MDTGIYSLRHQRCIAIGTFRYAETFIGSANGSRELRDLGDFEGLAI
jgi:hypothetical protein